MGKRHAGHGMHVQVRGQFQCFPSTTWNPAIKFKLSDWTASILLPQSRSTPTGPKSFFRGLEMEQEGKNVPLPRLEILKTVFRIESGHLSPKALIHDQSAAHRPHKTMKSCRASISPPAPMGFQLKHPWGICILFSRNSLL